MTDSLHGARETRSTAATAVEFLGFAVGTSSAPLRSLARGWLMLLLIVWFRGTGLPLHGHSFRETPYLAGVLMMPMIAGFLFAGPLSGWLSDR